MCAIALTWPRVGNALASHTHDVKDQKACSFLLLLNVHHSRIAALWLATAGILNAPELDMEEWVRQAVKPARRNRRCKTTRGVERISIEEVARRAQL